MVERYELNVWLRYNAGKCEKAEFAMGALIDYAKFNTDHRAKSKQWKKEHSKHDNLTI